VKQSIFGVRISQPADGSIYLTVQRLKGSLKTHQKLVTSSNPLLDEQTVLSTFLAGMKPDDLLFHESGKRLRCSTSIILSGSTENWPKFPRTRDFRMLQNTRAEC